MAHKTLVGGTAYEVKGGKTLVGGTGYEIAKGRTLVGGTGYDIPFKAPTVILQQGSIQSSGISLNSRVQIWLNGVEWMKSAGTREEVEIGSVLRINVKGGLIRLQKTEGGDYTTLASGNNVTYDYTIIGDTEIVSFGSSSQGVRITIKEFLEL